MGILSLFRSKKSLRGDPLNDKLFDTFVNTIQVGGQRVNYSTAEKLASVFACKIAIAESIAMLPAVVLSESDEMRKSKLKDHSLWELLRVAPNDMMDSFEFYEAMEHSLLDHGNAYAHILRSRSKEILSLTPLDATRVKPRVMPGNTVVYAYTDPQGQTQDYPPDQIFHVKIHSRDGLIGRSPIAVAADAVGFPLAVQQHGNKLFENGAFLSGFLSAPFAFKDDETRKAFMDSFKKVIGANNSGKFGLLEQGVDYKPFSQNNRDAQFLEAKQFAVVDIARLFRMPPHMIQVLEKGASFASIEQMSINFVQYTIQPWVTRWERAIKRQLLNQKSEKDMYVRFNISALIRGDLASRTSSIIQLVQYGLKTINEGRFMLDDDAVDSPIGDEILLSHNLRPASVVIAEAKAEPETEPEAEPVEPAPPEKAPIVEDDDESERFKPLLTELFGRIVRREMRLVADARNKPNFETWLSDWTPKHRELMSETFQAALFALGVADLEPANRFFDNYITHRREQMSSSEVFIDDSRFWAIALLNFLRSEI